MKRPIIFIHAILLCLLIASCSPTASPIETPAEPKKFLEEINVETIYSTIEELAKEPRVAGTESEEDAARFLTTQLESFGYEVEAQNFDFDNYKYPDHIQLTVDGFDQEINTYAFEYTISGNVSGELKDANLGTKTDYKDVSFEGKIALVEARDIYFTEIVKNAADAGAIAVIVHFQGDSPVDNWSLGNHESSLIPAVTIEREAAAGLKLRLAKEGTLDTKLVIEGATVEKANSQNLIAVKQPSLESKNEETVIIGAHYDSVDEAPGASDNASGTAVVLELARVYKDIPTASEIQFIFFGTEEKGLIGSTYFVENMTENERKQTKGMFNLDMVGSADAGPLAMMTANGLENSVTAISNQVLKDFNEPPISASYSNRSDHFPFHEAGIHSVLFIYDPVEEWYHTPDDTVDKLSKEKLHHVAKLVAQVVYEFTMVNEQ